MESINNAILVHRFMDIEYWVSRCAPGCYAELSSGPGPAESVQLGEREAGRESGAAVLGCRCDGDHGDRPCEVSSSRQRKTFFKINFGSFMHANKMPYSISYIFLRHQRTCAIFTSIMLSFLQFHKVIIVDNTFFSVDLLFIIYNIYG